jgi:hypothetical protein
MQAVLVLTTGISASRWGYSTYYLAFTQILQVYRDVCSAPALAANDRTSA